MQELNILMEYSKEGRKVKFNRKEIAPDVGSGGAEVNLVSLKGAAFSEV